MVDPEEITEKKIENHGEIFLREIADFESENKQTIGFNTERFERYPLQRRKISIRYSQPYFAFFVDQVF